VFQPLLQIQNLKLSYNAKQVIDDLTLELYPGEMLGILGPNGCGKSTLIKALSGVITPKAGTVECLGQPLLQLKPAARARLVGVVPQNPNLPSAFTAAEVVLLGRTPHLKFMENERLQDWELVRAAMEQASCWQLAERYIGELSGGERQRVLFAMVLAQNPQLLLLDEPTTFLDINYQAELMDIAVAWKRQPQRAIMAVFHDLNLAAQYCDRLALLYKGKLLAIGRPEQVITAENVRLAYGAQVFVAPHPLNALPTTFILPHSGLD
jgi:iron complex transport system ATP-binding protein